MAIESTLTRLEKTHYNIQDYGCVGDGITDNTEKFNAMLQYVFDNGGGTIFIPKGTFRCTGQINIPFDVEDMPGFGIIPHNRPMRITGEQTQADGNWFRLKNFVSCLQLDFDAPVAKIITIGDGALEMDHISLVSQNQSDTSAFIFTAHTTLNINKVSFTGAKCCELACNDAIICGSTGADVEHIIDTTAPFRGFGTLIHECFFDSIRYALKLHTAGSGIRFMNNAISKFCGNTTGGCIYTDGHNTLGGANNTNTFINNYFELSFYKYCYEFHYTMENSIFGNSYFDQILNNPFVALFSIDHSGNNYINLVGNTNNIPVLFENPDDIKKNTVISANHGNRFQNRLACGDENTDFFQVGFRDNLNYYNRQGFIKVSSNDNPEGAGILFGSIGGFGWIKMSPLGNLEISIGNDKILQILSTGELIPTKITLGTTAQDIVGAINEINAKV